MIFRLNKFLKTSWFNHNKREGLLVTKKKKDDSLWNFLFGLGVGIAGYTIISKFLARRSPRCPICHSKVQPRSPRYPICQNELI